MALAQENGVHLAYKNLGETPLECLTRWKENNHRFEGVAMTYAGRLDPMAEGLLIFLSGEKLKNKQEYLNLPKKYICQILWGVETDSLDILGMVTRESDKAPDSKIVSNTINHFAGVFSQEYPAYSSKPFLGKPLFWWSRMKGLVRSEDKQKFLTHEVELLGAKYLSRKKVEEKEILETILSRISLVKGDFRQEEIKNEWMRILNEERVFIIDTVELEVSRGFYVRQFISDMAARLGKKALTFHIKRVKVGEYSI